MDHLKDMAGSAGGIGEMLQGIDFPIQKDQLAGQLPRKGVPSQITDELRGADTDQVQNQDATPAMGPSTGGNSPVAIYPGTREMPT